MPRIRSIKPAFWSDQKLARLDSFTRFVFVCLWSMADDDGRLEADAETVMHFGFPRERAVVIERALVALDAIGRVRRYESDGTKYLQIVNWRKHQKIDHPSPSQLPAPPPVTEDSPKPRESSRIRASPRESSRGIGYGLDGIGGDGKSLLSAGADLTLTAGTGGAADGFTAEAFVQTWNEVCPPRLPAAKAVTAKRRKRIAAAAVIEPNLATWRTAFDRLASSAFHAGGNERGWKADIDFILQDEQMGKWLDLAGQGVARQCEGCAAAPAVVHQEGFGWYCGACKDPYFESDIEARKNGTVPL